MSALAQSLWRRLAAWFEQAVPLAAEGSEAQETHRRSIRDVTYEQLSISHRSCHTHF